MGSAASSRLSRLLLLRGEKKYLTRLPFRARIAWNWFLIRLVCAYGLPGYTVKWFEPEKGRYRFLNRILERVSALNNSYSRRYQPWPAEISDRLQTYYRHENAGLSELIGRDVDAIWYGGDRKESAMDQLANVVQ